MEFLRSTLELGDTWSVSDILESIYIMYTNSVNMDMDNKHGMVTGFYPVFANMNHDCNCNTKTIKMPNNRLEVRSVRPISAGEEITTQYVSPDKHTKLRRQLLHKKWSFWCECDRCRDRTELRSYLGAFICQVINEPLKLLLSLLKTKMTRIACCFVLQRLML